MTRPNNLYILDVWNDTKKDGRETNDGETKGEAQTWRASLENVHTQERRQFGSLEGLSAFLAGLLPLEEAGEDPPKLRRPRPHQRVQAPLGARVAAFGSEETI